MLDPPSTDHQKGPKDHRRQQLIEATIQTISKFGLSNTTIARVTQAAKLSTGIVGFYFKNKEHLLLGTLEYIDAEYNRLIKTVFTANAPPEAIVRKVLEVNFDPIVCDPDKIAVWNAFSSESGARKEYMKICGEHDQAFHNALLDCIRSLCGRYTDKEMNPEAITRGLTGLIDGYWQAYLFSPAEFDRTEAIRIGIDYLSAVFPDHFPLDGEPDSSFSGSRTSELLAPWTYRDKEFLALEQEILFKQNWLLVGHINDIAEPRSYLTLDAVGERALIIRGSDNQIRAFHNVCRHRGAKLFDKRQGHCAPAITCPFHGWTYQLDGQLVGVPAHKTFGHLTKQDHGLVPLEFEIWMGFVFVRFKGTGPSLAERMKPVEPLLAPYRIEQMQSIDGTRYAQTRPYNWKVIHDIDNEGYHVPIGHPALQQLYGKGYRDDRIGHIAISYAPLNEETGKFWSVRHYQKLLPEFDHLPKSNQRLWLYVAIFPNMVLGLYPDSIEFYMTLPLSTDQTIYRGGSYGLPDDRRETRAIRYLNRRINQSAEQEDARFIDWLQDAMQSSVFPEPRLSTLESGVRDFHRQLQDKLPVATLKRHPGPGKVRMTNRSMQSGRTGRTTGPEPR